MSTVLPTPLCTGCTRRALSPCPSLNLIHYKKLCYDVSLNFVYR
ncbi:hypothetical protein [Kingella kingae]|nr:hypothetical protein [Kingella kingae]MDK4539678.1 hypothetical protein [Kingella kingae]MDK4589537.1 hypothetical protein [Kingella kingae]